MKKINDEDFEKEIEKEIIITDALLRLSVLEKLLISKGIITPEEFNEAMDTISKQVVEVVLKNAKVPASVDDVIKSIKNKKPIEN